MSKYVVELGWNYDDDEYRQFLLDHDVVHLKSHGDRWFKVGDALRSRKGVIARVVDRFANRENLSIDITIANNKLSYEEMDKHFDDKTLSAPSTFKCKGYS